MKNLISLILLFISIVAYGQHRIQYIGDSYFTSAVYIRALNDEIHPLSVNTISRIGATIQTYNNQQTMSRISKYNPDAVVISLGTNSSYITYNKTQHTVQLNTFIHNIRMNTNRKCKIIFITPFMNYRNGKPNMYARQCADNIANVCISQNCYVINTYNMFGNMLKAQRMLARDNIHLTSRGYSYVGHSVGQVIKGIIN